jgi:hypothetical protein
MNPYWSRKASMMAPLTRASGRHSLTENVRAGRARLTDSHTRGTAFRTARPSLMTTLNSTDLAL